MLAKLVALRERAIYHVAGTPPAVYYVADRDAGGVLVNAPPFGEPLLAALRALAPPAYLFLPSRRGARDLERWRAAGGIETIAFEAEAPHVAGTVDVAVGGGRKLTRTIDFLPMSGVTEGSCALRIKNDGGAIFFGPVLEPGADGWPTLMPHADDYSAENRLIGALGLQDQRFEYAFTDVFEPGRTRFGPGAGTAVNENLRRVLDD
jgi:glyoxylase-like metal-dependent hydrolase (beta-lactamase superfamily II)